MLVQIVNRQAWHFVKCLLLHALREYMIGQQNASCCHCDFDDFVFLVEFRASLVKLLTTLRFWKTLAKLGVLAYSTVP